MQSLTQPSTDTTEEIAEYSLQKRGYTEPEAAYYLGVSRTFLRQARMNGDRKNHAPGPAYVKIGRMVRYLKEDLDMWLEQSRRIKGIAGIDA